MLRRFVQNIAILFAAVAAIAAFQSTSFAQLGGGGAGGGGAGGAGQVPGSSTGGIEIDANGVLTKSIFNGNPQLLNRQRYLAAQASINKDIQRPSQFRAVSLNRLEATVQKMLDAGQPITDDVRYLAGLTRITHVFFYPESNDIVIAGPAEGFFINANNHVVGMKSGRSTLQLQDLIVALRSFSPDGKQTKMISCSIDPTQEGLARFRDTYTQIASSGQFRPGLENDVIRAYQEALGWQEITIQGISPKTNFARVLVEADYEMKLIGIGLKRAPVDGVISFISKVTPAAVAKNSLQRWYFQPDYDCVQVNEDNTAMQLIGDGVKLVGEDESVAADGSRKGKGSMSRASTAYCNSFTRLYGKMAERDPLWGELRNVIDMSVAAAFIQKMDLYEKSGWKMNLFGDEKALPVEILEAPTKVAPVANAVWKGSSFMSPIAGGVSIQPRVALNSDRIKRDNAAEIDKIKSELDLSSLEEGQWWWDN